jgi:sialate O-acetylesterase
MLIKIILGTTIAVFCFSLFSFQLKTKNKPLQLNVLFTDHMVLQQKRNVAFWGVNAPNEKVTISAGWGKSETTITDSDGNWKLHVLTPKAGGPYTIHVRDVHSNILIKDVLIGEVWLASGQSNMEMPLRGWPPNDAINNSKEEIEKSDYSEIRMFTVQRQLSLKPMKTFKGW